MTQPWCKLCHSGGQNGPNSWTLQTLDGDFVGNIADTTGWMPQQSKPEERGSNQFHQETVECNKRGKMPVATAMTTAGGNRRAATRCWSKLCRRYRTGADC